MGFLKRMLKGRESDLHQTYLPPERVQKRVRTEGITFKLEVSTATVSLFPTVGPLSWCIICPQSCYKWLAVGRSNVLMHRLLPCFPQLIKAVAVDSGLPGCVEIAREIRRKKLDERSGDAVLFTVAPTRIHVVRRNPWVWNWSSLSAYTKYKWRLPETKDLCCYFLIDMPRLSIVTTLWTT